MLNFIGFRIGKENFIFTFKESGRGKEVASAEREFILPLKDTGSIRDSLVEMQTLAQALLPDDISKKTDDNAMTTHAQKIAGVLERDKMSKSIWKETAALFINRANHIEGRDQTFWSSFGQFAVKVEYFLPKN